MAPAAHRRTVAPCPDWEDRGPAPRPEPRDWEDRAPAPRPEPRRSPSRPRVGPGPPDAEERPAASPRSPGHRPALAPVARHPTARARAAPGRGAGTRAEYRPGQGHRPDYGRRPESVIDPAVALAEDEELVAGRRPVEEAFVARREAKRLLVVPQRRMALEKLVLHAMNLRIPVVEVEGGTLTAVAGFDGHQGIALVVAPRRWASPDDILALAAQRGEPPLVLVLDSLEDPQNVGTLLRTAEASGVHGAIFPTHRQAPLTPAAVKASAGAVEHLRLSPVDDLAGALADLHARGLRIVGADGDAPLTAREADLRGPVAIVVGSEGRGSVPRSAVGATSWSASRCTGTSSRSMPPSPGRSSSTRPPPSAASPRRRVRGTRRSTKPRSPRRSATASARSRLPPVRSRLPRNGASDLRDGASERR